VRSFAVLLLACGICLQLPVEAQTRRRTPALKTEPAKVSCPALLGRGAKTKAEFCDVLTGRDPKAGIVVTIPPHTGPAFVSFTLHNRHTYSQEEVRQRRAYAQYTAIVGLLTMDERLLQRAAVQSEFFNEGSLYDRIEGGAGPSGFKAVAPVGAEQVRIEVPASVNEVSLLGERLQVTRLEREDTYSLPGTPIATVSGVQVQYRPRPAARRR
jgi:hypothetical protein